MRLLATRMAGPVLLFFAQLLAFEVMNGWLLPEQVPVARAFAWTAAAVGLASVGLVLWLIGRAPSEGAWMAGLLDGMAEGVIAFDQRGRVVFANRAALELLGRRGIPQGTPMAAFADVPRFRSSVGAALRGEPGIRELEVPGPPARAAVMRTSLTPDGVIAVLTDVSDMRRLERSWRDFASNASHELRTPAAACLANLEVLDELLAERSDARPFLQGSVRQARRMADLVSDLLDLARLDSGQAGLRPAPVRVAEVASRIVEEIRLASPGDSVITLEIEDLPLVQVDPRALGQMLNNLISNAVRYAPGQIAVVASRHVPFVRLEVRDRGPGVPEEHRAHLFDRFYRVDAGRSRAQGGTGLGLAIVAELVEASGGRLGLDPAPGGGCVFWIELPVAKEL